MEDNYIYKINDLSLENDALMVNETIFHNANGYIGVRANFEEGYQKGCDSIRGSYINGFYDLEEMKQAEKLCGFVEEKQVMLNVADTQGITLKLGEETFSMFEGTVNSSCRYLDMKGGYTVREVDWTSPKGHRISVKIKRMTSFELLPLFTIEYTATSLDYEGKIELVSTHIGDVKNYCNPNDPRVAAESNRHLIPVEATIENGVSYLLTDTAKSGQNVCTAVENVLSKEGKTEILIDGHSAVFTWRGELARGEGVTLTKYTVFADSARTSDTKRMARESMESALAQPLSYWYDKQKEYLADFWKQSSLDIDGDDELNIAVHYNLYQLIQSVSKDEHGNVAAKGLSGEGYEGHYFWDTEMYMQPFFVLTNPDIAKNLIEYRYSTLEAARGNAGILGHKRGVLFPWRTIMGKECSGYYPSGTAQYHINGDIAYAVVAYYLATKNLDFIAEKGAEIVIETARLWLDVGNFYNGKFVINAVTGPDEYTCMVNNNYFTNVSAQYNLHWAIRFCDLLKDAGKYEALAEKLKLKPEEIEEFRKAEECMLLLYDEERGINPQDDSFLSKPIWDIEGQPADKFPLLLHYHPLLLYRYQVCKQADTVLAHFIFEDAQSIETIRKSFAYYEKVTTHDSSLSRCIYSIVANKLGLVEKAYDYFGDSAKLDLFNTHNNTKDGIHTANMGGNYMAIVYGFGGLRLKESGIYFEPTLPKEWNAYRFLINYEGSQIHIEVGKEAVTLRLVCGDEKMIHIYGELYTLTDELCVARKGA